MLNVLRTADVCLQAINFALKPFDLTFTQYNVLRILKGAGKEGITCSELSGRMVARDPDITRLLDRMERRKLTQRERSEKDRRVVMTFISPTGVELLAEAEKPLRQTMRSVMTKLEKMEISSLIHLLEKLRTN